MSNQLKLFLYIVFVAAIFLFVQTKFHIFDINMGDNKQKTADAAPSDNTVPQPSNYVEIITGAAESVKVNVEIADTDYKRRLGLSFRKYLGDYDGMFFAFDTEVNTPFWMKDMQIPLDMIFFDSLGFIVDMKEAVAPCTDTYCPSIYSAKNYKYVLEVNSGFIQKNSIPEGGSLVLHLESLN